MSEENTYDAAAAVDNNKGPAPEINLGDFAVAVAIIDTVAKRGAFEGQEVADVGRLRERLTNFIEYHKPNDEAPQPPEEAVAAETLDSADTDIIDIDDVAETEA